jgi:DNA topoisomerase-1
MKENEYTEKIEKMPEEGETLKEKIYKSRKEKLNEERKDFVPLRTPRHTVEVAAKPKLSKNQIETIEIISSNKNENNEKRKTKKILEKSISKPKKAKNSPVEKTANQFKELSGRDTLIITEKPQAASKIAAALSDGRAKSYSDGGVSYYEFEKNGKNIIVACAVGHLFSLSQDIKGSGYPIFEISWKPNFEVRKKDFTKKYYSNLARLVKRAGEIIIATDYDVEGEVIGYNIVRFIAHQKDAKRMKYSSLTKEELEEAFKNSSPNIDWGQAIAGETRHFIDWYYGINLSRALMNSIKTTGRFRIMSVGRVQGPALKLIVDKEKEIEKFKPIPYWKIFIEVQEKNDKTNFLKLRHVKDIFHESELKKFENLKNKEAEVTTEKKQQTIIPPYPFDLTTLQTEAYRLLGINPAKTLQIAQELYLAGLISYPRTSSQKIPEAINPKAILKKLAKLFKEVKNANRTRPIEGKKSDPAHPSIYPTGETPEIEGEAKKLYEIIARRFISCFSADAVIENKTVTAISEGLIFKEKGAEIKIPGWMDSYPANIQEKQIKDMNGKADIIDVKIEKDETKPPKRFSPASIVSELEKRGLGTKATRANILETLYDRNYITDQKSIRATPLGINLIETLEKHSPIIIDEKLTRSMEKDMDSIRDSKKDLQKKEETILNNAKESLIKISEDFHKKEKQIGEDLINAEKDYWKQQNEENELALCPNCKIGKLTIKYSPKNKKFFVACNAYPNCKTTFSLPPYGTIKKIGKTCNECGFPLLMSLRKAKRPWIFCFNPQCPSRQTGVVKAKENPEEKYGQEDSSKQENTEIESTE